MLLSQRVRAHTTYIQGCGGRHCPCCDNPRKDSARMRRTLRRVEKQAWRRSLKEED